MGLRKHDGDELAYPEPRQSRQGLGLKVLGTLVWIDDHIATPISVQPENLVEARPMTAAKRHPRDSSISVKALFRPGLLPLQFMGRTGRVQRGTTAFTTM